MEQQHETALSSEEKTLALVSHLSMFFGGLIVPIIIYFIQKNKSKFAAFNALEAIYFHLLYAVVAVIAVIIFITATAISSMATNSSRGEVSPIVWILLGLFGLFFFAAMIYFIVYAIITAIKSFQGQIKIYPMVGKIAYRQVYGN